MRRAPLSVSGLVVRHGDRVAIDDVHLSVPAGSSLAVIGPNGSGKSTLLLAIAGLLTPTQGRVERAGASVAVVLQSMVIDRTLPISVLEAVRLARYPRLGLFRRFTAVDHEAVERAMRRVEVHDLSARQLHELSGGQRQRVLVAQGLAQEADVLLLDEPVAGLDIRSTEVILDAVRTERDAGRSVVVTTHSLEEARRCDRVLLLATRVVAQGTPDEVIRAEHLAEAFGGHFVRLDDGAVFVDVQHAH